MEVYLINVSFILWLYNARNMETDNYPHHITEGAD